MDFTLVLTRKFKRLCPSFPSHSSGKGSTSELVVALQMQLPQLMLLALW